MIIGALILTSCQLSPVHFDREKKGQWNAKILVKDKKHKRSFILNATFQAVYPEKLRIDFITPLGGHLASFLFEGQKAKYYLVKKRVYYVGKVSRRVFSPIFPLKIHPYWIYNILFDKPFAEKGWKCQWDKKGYLERCKKGKIQVVWKNRYMKRKFVYISHPLAEIQINFTTFHSYIDQPEKAFQLKIPKGFEVHYLSFFSDFFKRHKG
ncbi:MAG: hypothetical protein D6797_05375 [Bdellovibrio sp.]|nr:MAG: hypothetical protein D6797_05375 [Bdellovibrio sp.]